jgi:hypothetical protein
MLSALQTKFGASMVVANMIGGVVVFVFLGFVLPRHSAIWTPTSSPWCPI